MTPGTLKAPIYKGARYQHTLTIYTKGTNTPVNLTGLSPFVFAVSHPNRDAVLTTFAVTHPGSDLVNGRLTVTGLPSQTEELKLGPVRIGLRDVQGNPYMSDTVNVLHFSPDPP